jgi:LPS-assembly protein
MSCLRFTIHACLIFQVVFFAHAAVGDVLPASVPVHLTAREMTYDDKAKILSALGAVEIEQEKNLLRADTVTYDIDKDLVTAEGNVSLLDADGNVGFADKVSLTGDLKTGAIQKFLSILADGSRFTAEQAERENGTRTVMKNVSYTPCKTCEAKPNPLWQITADEVVHDQVEKSVSYKKARFEFMGVPTVIVPVFSHADPSVKRKSGFLRPTGGWTDELGTYFQSGYYFGDIAPNMDASVFVRPTTRAGVLVQGQWRQRFDNARLQLDASTAQSDRKRDDGLVREDRWRGHVAASGLLDIDDKWRAGMNFARVSDKGYLRLYDLSNEDVLESKVFAERFSGRNYSRISALTFQDVRIGPRPEQPDVLPSIEHSMVGASRALLGGRWDLDAGLKGIQRGGDAQSVQRASFTGGWERRDTLANGVLMALRLQADTDAFFVQENAAAAGNPAIDSSPNSLRGQAAVAMKVSYPLMRRFEKSRAVIEPVVGFVLASHVEKNDNKIPNEDSIDIQLDTNNLFEINRFPGRDRAEDGMRFNYGLQAAVYADNGRSAKVFMGQSYRFNEDTLFPEGSGLDNRASDLVGQVNLALSKYLQADYRFQMDSRTLSSRRHEAAATGGNDLIGAKISYIYIDGVVGTGLIEAREQLQVDWNLNLTKNWWINASTLNDFGDEPGLRRGVLGLNYMDECFSFSLEGVRNLIREESGESGTVLMARVGLRNLGQFSSPRITLQSVADTENR